MILAAPYRIPSLPPQPIFLSTAMLIRIGYDIELGVSAPTALIYMLQVHPTRAGDVVGSENTPLSPPLVTDFYRDSFDNQCARVRVPAGVTRVRLRNEAQVFD